MRLRIKVEGLRELDKSLGELSKGAARGVLRRALLKAGEPMRAAAEKNAPKDTGALKRSVILGTKVSNPTGKREFAAVMRGGGSKAQAVKALRDARRAGGESFAEVFMGPAKGSKRDAIKAIAQEFGTQHHPAQPYMRPAFDSQKHAVVSSIRAEIKTELDKSIRRAKARALKKAMRGKR